MSVDLLPLAWTCHRCNRVWSEPGECPACGPEKGYVPVDPPYSEHPAPHYSRDLDMLTGEIAASVIRAMRRKHDNALHSTMLSDLRDALDREVRAAARWILDRANGRPD